MVPIILALLALGITAPAAAQSGAPDIPDVAVIQPGDILQINIWREPDLSGDFLVDESGRAVLPLLGPMQLEGLSLEAVRDTLLRRYEGELRNPSIMITPLRRVYILGDVNAPGLKTVDPTLTLAGVIALAGGANAQGDLRRIQIVREGEVIRNSVSAASVLAGVDVRSGDQIFVGRRSWFERNSTFVVSALLSVTSIIVTLAQ